MEGKERKGVGKKSGQLYFDSCSSSVYRISKNKCLSMTVCFTIKGWDPNPDSKLLALTKKCFKELNGEEPNVLAIHAGLECGVISAKCLHEIDTVSFGPTILDAHSPDERVKISTVKPFFRLVLMILDEIVTSSAP